MHVSAFGSIIQQASNEHPGQRVFQTVYQGDPYFVKLHIPSKINIFHRLQSLAFRLTHHPLLAITILDPGKSETFYEGEKLIRLKQLGLNVPAVLDYSEEYLIIEDCGRCLADVISENPQAAQSYLEKALVALGRLHRAGQCHGGAQIRNFTVKDEQIFMIDFEECTPEQYLEDLAFRDLLLFFLSLSSNINHCSIPKLIRVYEENSGMAVRSRLLRLAKRLEFLRVLTRKPWVRWVGKDVLMMNAILEEFRRQMAAEPSRS
jgi:tRNA A-37 threonylcarbamoyl transferase component Bud32